MILISLKNGSATADPPWLRPLHDVYCAAAVLHVAFV
jgi:hypothetical protein